MNLYAFGYWYVCDPLLAPVVRQAEYYGHTVHYQNAWTGREARPSFEAWLGSSAPERVFLLACDINTGAHMPGVERVQQCRVRGIPTVSIMHGIPPECLEAKADTVCVWGQRFSQMFKGAAPVVTGNPALENTPSPEYARRELAQRVGITAPYALFAASLRNRYSNPDLLKRAIQEVAGLPMSVVISPHPNPAEAAFAGWFFDIAARTRNVRVLERGHDLLRLLVSGAELVFGRSSVLVEAAAQGVPALAVRDMPDVYADGKIYHQYDGLESIRAALRSSPNAEFTFRHLYHLDGSAGRVMDVLARAASGRLPVRMQEVERAAL